MDPGLLVIILFIVAPLIEKLIKAGKQPPDVPPQRRPPTQRAPRPVEREETPQARIPRRPPAREERENAVDILPEDLWAILTGQQPPPRPTPRPGPRVQLPEPEPEPEHVAGSLPTHHGESGYAYDEAPSYDDAVQEEIARVPVRRSAEEIVVHEPGRVVSLEQLEFDDEKRHDRFHDRLAALPKPASAPAPAAHRFTSDADLRRAIIMTEVLGKPKGLE